jgi:hypothetical protein
MLVNLPSLILINPAAATLAPCKNELCWKVPDFLMPTYSLKFMSATKIQVFDFVVFRKSRFRMVAGETWTIFFTPFFFDPGSIYRSASSESEVPESEDDELESDVSEPEDVGRADLRSASSSGASERGTTPIRR